jgi:hypothetical protein
LAFPQFFNHVEDGPGCTCHWQEAGFGADAPDRKTAYRQRQSGMKRRVVAVASRFPDLCLPTDKPNAGFWRLPTTNSRPTS